MAAASLTLAGRMTNSFSVALAAQLLTDAASPLYAPSEDNALYGAARAALLALTPQTEGVLTWT